MRMNFRAFSQAIITSAVVLASGHSLATSQTNGNDTSHYRVLGWDKNHIAIVNAKGDVEWEYPNEAGSMHDIQLLPNGNILFHNGTAVREVTREKKIVWEYVSKPKEGYTGRVTVHSFERLPNGLTMIAESGNQRIIEVDKDGKIVHEIPL